MATSHGRTSCLAGVDCCHALDRSSPAAAWLGLEALRAEHRKRRCRCPVRSEDVLRAAEDGLLGDEASIDDLGPHVVGGHGTIRQHCQPGGGVAPVGGLAEEHGIGRGGFDVPGQRRGGVNADQPVTEPFECVHGRHAVRAQLGSHGFAVCRCECGDGVGQRAGLGGQFQREAGGTVGVAFSEEQNLCKRHCGWFQSGSWVSGSGS